MVIEYEDAYYPVKSSIRFDYSFVRSNIYHYISNDDRDPVTNMHFVYIKIKHTDKIVRTNKLVRSPFICHEIIQDFNNYKRKVNEVYNNCREEIKALTKQQKSNIYSICRRMKTKRKLQHFDSNSTDYVEPANDLPLDFVNDTPQNAFDEFLIGSEDTDI